MRLERSKGLRGRPMLMFAIAGLMVASVWLVGCDDGGSENKTAETTTTPTKGLGSRVEECLKQKELEIAPTGTVTLPGAEGIGILPYVRPKVPTAAVLVFPSEAAATSAAGSLRNFGGEQQPVVTQKGSVLVIYQSSPPKPELQSSIESCTSL
jgi:hypothetical protein